MLKHIVAFKFKDNNKAEFMAEIKKDLEQLQNSIEELIFMEVGINIVNDSEMPDLVLYSTFNDEKAMEVYKHHPEHMKVVEKMKLMVVKRTVVDYLI